MRIVAERKVNVGFSTGSPGETMCGTAAFGARPAGARPLGSAALARMLQAAVPLVLAACGDAPGGADSAAAPREDYTEVAAALTTMI